MSGTEAFAYDTSARYRASFSNVYANEGVNAPSPISFNIESPYIALPKLKDRPGYSFAGWKNTRNGATVSGITHGTVGDLSLSAQWTLKPLVKYTINFVNSKGVSYGKKTYTNRNLIGLPTKINNKVVRRFTSGNLTFRPGEILQVTTPQIMRNGKIWKVTVHF